MRLRASERDSGRLEGRHVEQNRTEAVRQVTEKSDSGKQVDGSVERLSVESSESQESGELAVREASKLRTLGKVPFVCCLKLVAYEKVNV